MDNNTIESMKDFAFFKKLKKTKKNDPMYFFNSSLFNYYIAKIKKKECNKPFDDKYINSYNIPYPEEILINELKKPNIIKNDLSASFSKKDLNKKSLNKNNKPMRNIDSMLMSLKKNKNCIRFLKNNLFTDDQIRLLLSIATTNHYKKDEIIYSANTRATKFFMVLKGKVVIKTLIPDKIRELTIKNSNKFEKIYENYIKSQEAENILQNVDMRDIADDISETSFVSKDNISSILNEFDKNNNENNDKKNDNNNINIKKTNIKRKRHSIDSIINKSFNIDKNKNILFSPPFITQSKNHFNRMSVFLKQHKDDDFFIEKSNNIANILNLQNKLGYVTEIYNPGNFFGEKELISEKPYTDSAYAETETDLLIIDKVHFDKYISKQISLADLTRRNFLVRYIPFLQPEQLANAHIEFHDKDEIIYTQYDKAEEFYLIYQGSGILKKVNNNKFKCNKKSDIINNKNDLDTVCFIDKGCLVGLECYKNEKYDNNFIIMEDNTILFRFCLKDYYRSNVIFFKYQHTLNKSLKNLYTKHKKFFTCFQNFTRNLNTNNVKNSKNKISEDDYQITEEKCKNIFDNASKYKITRNNFSKNRNINKTQVFSDMSNLKKNFLINKFKQKHNNSNVSEFFEKNKSIKLKNNDLTNNQYKFQNLNNNANLCRTISNNSFLKNKSLKSSSLYNIKKNPINILHKNSNLDLYLYGNKLKNIILKKKIINNHAKSKLQLNSTLTSSIDIKPKTILSEENIKKHKKIIIKIRENTSENDLFIKSSKDKKYYQTISTDKYLTNMINYNTNKMLYNSGNFNVPLIAKSKKRKFYCKISSL